MPAFEAIASTTLSVDTANVVFSSIPSTYEHLQIRSYVRSTRVATRDGGKLILNSDTGTNYAWHRLYTDGATITAGGSITQDYITWQDWPAASSTANIFGCGITEILDYTNTNKYTTVRHLGGNDQNGSGEVHFSSGVWLNTAAVTTITLSPFTGSFLAGTIISLYGLRSS